MCEAIMGYAIAETETTATTINVQAAAKIVNFKRKIFIGNISFRVKPAQLKSFLSKFGEVKNVQIVNDNAKHMSRRIAFATFASVEIASKAKMALPEDLQLNGREIRIRSAVKTRSKKKLGDDQLEFLNQNDFSDSSGINILNDYVLQHIFSYLDPRELLEVENVCKRWEAIAHSVWASCHSLKFTKVLPFFMEDPNLEDLIVPSWTNVPLYVDILSDFDGDGSYWGSYSQPDDDYYNGASSSEDSYEDAQYWKRR